MTISQWANQVSPIFNLGLQDGILPTNSNGSGTPTFTRADGTNITGSAYATDFEGRLVLVPPGVPRIQGARFVKNYAKTPSNTLTGANYVLGATGTATTVRTANYAANPIDGEITATRFQFTKGTGMSYVDAASNSITNGHAVRNTLWLKSNSGTATIAFYDGNVGASYITVTSTWQRFSTSVVTVVGGVGDIVFGCIGAVADATADIIAYAAQVEDVTGQTNQNPSEYVSVGVLSAPFHGAGIDGCKWFSTLNGNTVSSNVVTEATNAAINSSQGACAGGVTAGVVDASGPLGYLAESAATNSLTYSQQFDNAAWVKPESSITANQYIAPDGTMTMDRWESNANNLPHIIYQAQTFTAAAQAFSCYVKYVNWQYVALRISDGTTTVWVTYDLLAGTVTNEQAPSTGSIQVLGGGYFRITQKLTTLAAAGNVAIYFANSSAYTGASFAGATTDYIGIWQADLVAASFPSSPIIVPAGTAITRAADVLTYVRSGNLDLTQGSFYCESAAEGIVSGAFNSLAQLGNGASHLLSLGATDGSNLVYYDGTNVDSFTTGIPTLNVIYKRASSWGSAKANAFISGSQLATADQTFTSPMADGVISISGASSGISHFNGTTRNLKIYGKALTAAQLQAMTT